MSRVRLRVVLDEPDRVFLPGEAVEGRIEVEADEACRCRNLTAALRWHASGEANEASGGDAGVPLASGEWEAGARFLLPFSLVLPDGPPTYEGTNFSLRWSVEAEAGLAFAIDAKAAEGFEAGPRPAGDGALLTKEESGCAEIGCTAVAVAFLAGGGLPLLFSRRFPGIGYAIAAVAGGILAAVMIPFAMAYRAVGRVNVEAGPSPVARGEEMACRAVIVPRKDFKPRKVSAVLTAVESSPKGAGKGRKILARELAKVAVDLDGPSSLRAGQEAVFAGMLAIPADAPPSFVAGDHKVVWKLKVSVEFPVLPNPNWEFEVVVA